MTGALGERMAGLFLESMGLKVLYRNFRGAHGGEVDLVCRDRRTLVFVEVKTRLSLWYGRPAEAVTPSKEHLIRRGAKEWLGRLRTDDIQARFDVVEVILKNGRLPELNLIRDAFGEA